MDASPYYIIREFLDGKYVHCLDGRHETLDAAIRQCIRLADEARRGYAFQVCKVEPVGNLEFHGRN